MTGDEWISLVFEPTLQRQGSLRETEHDILHDTLDALHQYGALSDSIHQDAHQRLREAKEAAIIRRESILHPRLSGRRQSTLKHVQAVIEPLIVVNSIVLVLASVEFWSDRIHLCLVTSSPGRDAKEEKTQGSPPRRMSPSDYSQALTIRLSDDTDSLYELVHTGGEANEREVRLSQIFEPGPAENISYIQAKVFDREMNEVRAIRVPYQGGPVLHS